MKGKLQIIHRFGMREKEWKERKRIGEEREQGEGIEGRRYVKNKIPPS